MTIYNMTITKDEFMTLSMVAWFFHNVIGNSFECFNFKFKLMIYNINTSNIIAVYYVKICD